MQVELLYLDGCPHWQVADERLQDALVRAGRTDVRVTDRQIIRPEQADAARFRGSPTVLMDGRDPFADRDAPVGLSCRVFRTETGPAGAPTVDQLLSVLS